MTTILGETQRIVFGRNGKKYADSRGARERNGYRHQREWFDPHGAKLDLIIDFGAKHEPEGDDAGDHKDDAERNDPTRLGAQRLERRIVEVRGSGYAGHGLHSLSAA